MTRGGVRWSEAQLLEYQSRGGQVVNRPAPRLYAPVADVVTVDPGHYLVHLDNLKTQTEKNTSEHWWARAQRAREQRGITYRWLQYCVGIPCPLAPPWSVTLTRVAPGTLDSHDNLASALSHIVDGISDYLAGTYLKGQDRQQGLTWNEPQQQKGPAGRYGVIIQLEGTARPT